MPQSFEGTRCHTLSPLPWGSPQKTAPQPWQMCRNFPERFPPLFTLDIISVFAQRVTNVTGLLHSTQQPPTAP